MLLGGSALGLQTTSVHAWWFKHTSPLLDKKAIHPIILEKTMIVETSRQKRSRTSLFKEVRVFKEYSFEAQLTFQVRFWGQSLNLAIVVQIPAGPMLRKTKNERKLLGDNDLGRTRTFNPQLCIASLDPNR